MGYSFLPVSGESGKTLCAHLHNTVLGNMRYRRFDELCMSPPFVINPNFISNDSLIKKSRV